MATVVGTSKITSRGQITIPIEVREILGFAPGDRITFVEDEGNLIILGSNLAALRELGDAFTGAAQEAQITSDADVVSMINDLRASRSI